MFSYRRLIHVLIDVPSFAISFNQFVLLNSELQRCSLWKRAAPRIQYFRNAFVIDSSASRRLYFQYNIINHCPKPGCVNQRLPVISIPVTVPDCHMVYTQIFYLPTETRLVRRTIFTRHHKQ